MFKFLRDVVTTTVDASAYLVKGTVKVSTGIVAGTAELIGGENNVTKTIRAVGDGASTATDFVVDKAAAPLAKMVGKAVVRKTERIYDLSAGLAQATFTENKQQGLRRAAKAGAELTAIALTGGALGILAEELGDGVLSEPIGDAVNAVADFFDPDVHADAAAELVSTASDTGAAGFSLADADVTPAEGAGQVTFGGGGDPVRFGESHSMLASVSAGATDAEQTLEQIRAYAMQHNDAGFAAEVQNVAPGDSEQVKDIITRASEKYPRLSVQPVFSGRGGA